MALDSSEYFGSDLRSPWTSHTPEGLKPGLAWTPEAESHASGLPLADVLEERRRHARALEERERWTAGQARRMIEEAISAMDRAGAVPEEFERREDPAAAGEGRRWRDSATCGRCSGSGSDGYGGPCSACGGRGER